MAQDSKFPQAGGPLPAVIMSPEQFTTLLGHHHHGGLTEAQLDRIIAALQRRTALTPSSARSAAGDRRHRPAHGARDFAAPAARAAPRQHHRA